MNKFILSLKYFTCLQNILVFDKRKNMDLHCITYMFTASNAWNLRNTMKMNKHCPVCNQPLDLEVGFYFGSSYVSYAMSVALSVATFVAWWVLIGFSFHDDRFFYWLSFNCISLVLLQPYLMRVARTGWLSFFVRFDRNWRFNEPKPLERTNKVHENNW